MIGLDETSFLADGGTCNTDRDSGVRPLRKWRSTDSPSTASAIETRIDYIVKRACWCIQASSTGRFIYTHYTCPTIFSKIVTHTTVKSLSLTTLRYRHTLGLYVVKGQNNFTLQDESRMQDSISVYGLNCTLNSRLQYLLLVMYTVSVVWQRVC